MQNEDNIPQSLREYGNVILEQCHDDPRHQARLLAERTPDIVIYHAGCYDGFCAAWLCHQYWPNATYYAAQYNQNPPEDLKDKKILIVDFSYRREILEQINRQARHLRVLDHHKTAQQNLEGLPYCTFDANKSGARLTNEYLNNQQSHWLVDYTEDRDLWKHQLPHSRAINAAIRTYPLEFDAWDQLATRTTEDLNTEGTAILRYQQKIINHHVKYAQITTIAGYDAIITQSTVIDINSDIAEKMLQENPTIPIAIIATTTHDGTIHQLRSTTVDVSKIAETYGGGGHTNTAAFKLPDFIKTAKPPKKPNK